MLKWMFIAVHINEHEVMICIMKNSYENNTHIKFKLNIHLWFVSREQFWFFYRRQNVAVKHVLPLNIKYYEFFAEKRKLQKKLLILLFTHSMDNRK